MADVLLQTKLYRPTRSLALRPFLVPRTHLNHKLNSGLSGKLTLVSAPAGFGKTTLVAAWLDELGGKQIGIGWLSLDDNDNDPVRFFVYLVAALQTAVPGMGETALQLLQLPQPPPAETILTLLINDISQHDQPLVLVLDDYHTITTLAIHQALAFLLDHLPPQLHLLITTRSDPSLHLSRLRARRQMVEVRTNDLRFSLDEVRLFFNQGMGLTLSREEMAALERHTEGWVAGLQLAGLSMQGRDNLPDFVAAFTGSNRFILDYLTDEVLERRPPGTKNFLLQTAILDRLCGPLCAAVTGQSDSQAILEQLEQANLFLIPLDEERYWYRYHHLFADVLRNRLQQAATSSAIGVTTQAELHRRASAWFEKEGLIDEAIQHGLAAPDVERAAALVEQYSLLMFQRSEILRVRPWLEQLSAELVQSRPRLILAYGWILVLTGHGQTIEQWLAASPASEVLAAPNLAPDILGELALLRATQARYQGEDSRSLGLAQQALDYLRDDDRGLLAGAVYTIGVARLRQGDIAAATRAFTETVILGETKGGPYMALAALQELSELQVQQGQLSQVIQTCQQTMQMSARWGWQAMPAVGMAHIYLGQVLYEQNDLVKATQALTDGIGQLRGSTEQYFLARGYVTLSQIQLARGDPESALATIQQGEDWFTQLQVADLGGQTLLALGKVRLWLEQGKLTSVVHWFETCQWRAEATNAGYLQYLTLARLRLEQSRLGQPELFLPQTTEMLNQLLALKDREGWWGQVIELLLLQALVGQLQGNYAGALTILERALRLAEPEGYVRLFVDEGEPMAALLRQARQRGLFLNYVDNLLAAFPTDELKQRPADLLPEPLSERELEVLRLVATGVSNQEIADQLFIALSTVKKHVGNILVKLDTPNRVQAITRASELGLLS